MKRFLKLKFMLFLLLVIGSRAIAINSIIVDNETGCVLEEHGLNSRVPISSLTKVALAMVLLDWSTLCKKSLDQVVEVPPAAAAQGPSNPLGLASGDRLTLRDLLYLSLLVSDSQAAQTIAYRVGSQLPNTKELGPVDNFVSHMNALAMELKMKSTLFLNPSGLDMPTSQTQPYSTVADLARLIRYAYTKPGLEFYVSQKSREIHVERSGKSCSVTINNTNKLLGKECIDGVKTGSSPLAGECLILTSEHRPEVKKVGNTVYTAPRRIIVVLLNAPNRFEEGLALIQQGWSLYNTWAAEGRLTHGHEVL
ncbi:MAG: D-alanyl-D-alanine carboxypeptidase [Verrucomicrobia bacterium]|nr:MAG: D-alanyl-D-alanine carboxypeptidase [Verrucomicrobiota bacterium]